MIKAKSGMYGDEVSVSLRDRLERAYAYLTLNPLQISKEVNFWVGARQMSVIESRGAKRYVKEPIYRPCGKPSYELTIHSWGKSSMDSTSQTYHFATLAELEAYIRVLY